MGCSTTGKVGTINDKQAADIVKEKTTAEELIEMFGPPYVKMKISPNEQEWIYTFLTSENERLHSFDKESKHKMLNIQMRDGVVVGYTYHFGSLPAGHPTE